MRIARSPLLHSVVYSAGLSAIGAALAYLLLGMPPEVARHLFLLWAAGTLTLTAQSVLERWLDNRRAEKREAAKRIHIPYKGRTR